jgi:hypothetical protein
MQSGDFFPRVKESKGGCRCELRLRYFDYGFQWAGLGYGHVRPRIQPFEHHDRGRIRIGANDRGRFSRRRNRSQSLVCDWSCDIAARLMRLPP